MQTGEPLKLSLNFQCLSCTHCVLQISKHRATRFGTHSGMSSVHAVCSWLAYAQATQLLEGWDIACPMWHHWGRWSAWIQWLQMQLSYSTCTLVQEKSASVCWSKCLVPNPDTPPHHWDGQVEVDSLISASKAYQPVQSHSTGRKVRRRLHAADRGLNGTMASLWNPSAFRGKAKGNAWVRTVLWRSAVHLTQNLLSMWRTLSNIQEASG